MWEESRKYEQSGGDGEKESVKEKKQMALPKFEKNRMALPKF